MIFNFQSLSPSDFRLSPFAFFSFRLSPSAFRLFCIPNSEIIPEWGSEITKKGDPFCPHIFLFQNKEKNRK